MNFTKKMTRAKMIVILPADSCMPHEQECQYLHLQCQRIPSPHTHDGLLFRKYTSLFLPKRTYNYTESVRPTTLPYYMSCKMSLNDLRAFRTHTWYRYLYTKLYIASANIPFQGSNNLYSLVNLVSRGGYHVYVTQCTWWYVFGLFLFPGYIYNITHIFFVQSLLSTFSKWYPLSRR